MFDLQGEFDHVRRALSGAQIDYALCGGLAVGVHGFPRATVDIDLLIQPEDELRVYDVVGPLGFVVRAHPMDFDGGATRIRRVSKVDPGDGEVLMLDLLLVTPAIQGVWDTRQRFQWLGSALSVVSREGLIDLKKSRLSAIDLADIERLQAPE